MDSALVKPSLSYHPQRRRDRLLLLLVVSIATAVETLVAMLLFRENISAMVMAVGLHAAFLAVLGTWIQRRRRQHVDTRVHFLLALTCAGLGVIGAVGTLIVMAVIAVASRSGQPFDLWYQQLAPKHDPNDLVHLLQDIESGREDVAYVTQIEEFSTLLAHGAYREKQAVLSLVSRHYRPEFASLLRGALSSTDASLRVQAATAIEKVEAAFTRTWVRLQATSIARSHDYHAQLRLALHLDLYVESGLLEPPGDQQVRERALQAFQRCVALRPDLAEARLGLARSWVRCGQPTQAIVPLRAIPPALRTGEEWWCLADALFQARAFDEVRAVAREALATCSDVLAPEPRAVFTLWATIPPPFEPVKSEPANAA